MSDVSTSVEITLIALEQCVRFARKFPEHAHAHLGRARELIERLLREPKIQRGYCFGSGKPPTRRIPAHWVESSGRSRGYHMSEQGVCVECSRRWSLQNDRVSYHLATGKARELERLVDPLSVPCVTCGAEKGKKCITIEPTQTWDGKDLGRVELPRRASHRARKRDAERGSTP